jgi:DNA-directed RNA polymerase specialized sigma24 family protein
MTVAEHAEIYRATGADGRSSARETLALAVRTVVSGQLRRLRAPPVCGDDVAQDVTIKVTSWITEAKVTPGKEDGFARTCARHAWRTHLRGCWSCGTRMVTAEPARADAETGSGEAADAARLVGLVRAALDAAPLRYRLVLEQVYLHECDIAELVAIYRHENPASRDPRNAVDRSLSRARAWVGRRIVQLLREEGAGPADFGLGERLGSGRGGSRGST